jgi:hypothetical protein
MFMDPGQYPIDFRSGDKAESFVFTLEDVPNLGGRLTIPAGDRSRFFALFGPEEKSLAYRTEKGQGRFSTLAALRVFGIVRSTCPN